MCRWHVSDDVILWDGDLAEVNHACVGDGYFYVLSMAVCGGGTGQWHELLDMKFSQVGREAVETASNPHPCASPAP